MHRYTQTNIAISPFLSHKISWLQLYFVVIRVNVSYKICTIGASAFFCRGVTPKLLCA